MSLFACYIELRYFLEYTMYTALAAQWGGATGARPLTAAYI